MNFKNLFAQKRTITDIVELKVGDSFQVEVSIADAGGLTFRTASGALRWPVGVVAPVYVNEVLSYTDGNLFTGQSYDLIVKQLGDEIPFSKALKAGNSVSSTGVIVTVDFTAVAEGTGEIYLAEPLIVEVINNTPVTYPTEVEGSIQVNTSAIVIPTGTVLFRVRVINA
jgi:hypothetical protein